MFKEVPSQFDFPAAEKEILRFWEANDIYRKSLEQRKGSPQFVFYEGPPTANGMPHPGHCLTRTIKDIFPRYRTMTGHYCERKAGWDTHGLPVEAEVCKELGIHTKADIEKYGVEKFIKLCQKSVFRYMKEWEELTRRIGFWVDLKQAYVTYHQSYVESVWWALKTLFDRGLLFQDYKVVWWWPQGGTALSSGEVGQGYREVDDPSIYVLFPLVDDDRTAQLGLPPRTSLVVWTTTPWTLSSNMFAAVHPDFEYAVVRKGESGDYLVIAKSLVEPLSKKIKDVDPTPVKVIRGSELRGIRYLPPFNNYYNALVDPSSRHWIPDFSILEGEYRTDVNEHPVRFGSSREMLLGTREQEFVVYGVATADFVTLDSGTGIVHIAPAFGEDDFRLLQRLRSRLAWPESLAPVCAVAPDGNFNNEAPAQYRGRFVKACDKDIARELKDRGLVLHQEQYRHEYPFCWRAEEDPLIQYARKSWFVRTTTFRDEFLKNNNQINWLPDHIKTGRFGNFLENNVDWALSRERFWGTPLPIWQCEKTGKQEAIASYAELLGRQGVQGTDVWEKAKAADPDLIDDLKVHKPYIDAVTYDSPFAPGARMRRVPEVIDCWFDSGAMPFAQWGYPHAPGSYELFKDRFPADFISEAIDQTRGWFYTLLAISTMLFGEKQDLCGTAVSAVQRTGETPVPHQPQAGRLCHTFSASYPHPFRNCIVMGIMGGEDGKKLSKQKRNYKEPTYIFDKEGADAMRWSMIANQPPWTGARFKEDTIATDQREFLIKLYNVYSFFVIYANIDKWSPASPDAEDCKPSELDWWIGAEFQSMVNDVRDAMDRYENYPACRRIVDFVDALSNWYVRRSRERFWRSGMDADKKSAYLTLWGCLLGVSEVIAPFTPFLAETLYQNIGRSQFKDMGESVHFRNYPESKPLTPEQKKLIVEMSVVREIASLGRSARSDAKLKVRQPLPVVELVLADSSHRTWLETHIPLIQDELNVKRVEFTADADKYVTYEIKPNFKTIGPKFGPLAPKIKAALPKANAADLRRQLDADGKVSLTVEGQSVELTPEDVQVALSAKPGWAAAQGKQVVLVLSTELTPELKAEGMARDFVHLVQTARKEERLDYQARIRLRVQCEGPVAQAIQSFRDYIMGETLAAELLLVDGGDAKHTGEIEGQAVALGVEVIH